MIIQNGMNKTKEALKRDNANISAKIGPFQNYMEMTKIGGACAGCHLD